MFFVVVFGGSLLQEFVEIEGSGKCIYNICIIYVYIIYVHTCVYVYICIYMCVYLLYITVFMLTPTVFLNWRQIL